jgi:5-formyltetrahydrofolate cyclo-ligase
LNKEDLRNKIRALKIEQFGNNDRDYILLSSMICDLCSTFIHYQNSTDISIYASKSASYEPETDKIINYSIAIGKHIYLPRCISSIKNLELLEIKNIEEDTELGTFGLREPKKNISLLPQSALLKKINLIIVPGLAFDIFGNRLGYGTGYYDNFLRDFLLVNKELIVVGFAFDFQVFSEEIPHTDRDSRVHYIITPQSIIKTKTLNF